MPASWDVARLLLSTMSSLYFLFFLDIGGNKNFKIAMDVKKAGPEGKSSPATSLGHDVAVGTSEPTNINLENELTKDDDNESQQKYGLYHRSISPRQIHMISLGGQIGAGLFISTGKNLRDGGPAGILLAFAVVCSCVFAVLQTVSEMTIAFPVSGNFIEYADRFVDPALAFAAGISMWLGWTAIVAAEATFFATIVNYWAENRINDVVWCKFPTLLQIFGLLKWWRRGSPGGKEGATPRPRGRLDSRAQVQAAYSLGTWQVPELTKARYCVLGCNASHLLATQQIFRMVRIRHSDSQGDCPLHIHHRRVRHGTRCGPKGDFA